MLLLFPTHRSNNHRCFTTGIKNQLKFISFETFVTLLPVLIMQIGSVTNIVLGSISMAHLSGKVSADDELGISSLFTAIISFLLAILLLKISVF